MKISIVIPAYNEAERIESCLHSCLEHATSSLIEIIVVVNACTDNTERIAKSFSTVRVVRERRKGTSYARQKGFELSHGDIVAFLDADTHIHANWLNDIEHEFTNNSDLVCLSGPCVYEDLPTWKQTIIFYSWMTTVLPMYWISGYGSTGANFAVRRKSLEYIHGFDTSIHFYGDDTNVAKRLYAIGTVKYSPYFYNFTSSRRFQAEGYIHVAMQYLLNHCSQLLWNTTVSTNYGERPWEKKAVVQSTKQGTSQSITLRDGRSLEYTEYGDVRAKPMLYFHGFLGSGTQVALSNTLAKKEGMHIIAPNRPGIGTSSPKRFTTMTEYADDIDQLTTQLGIQTFSIFGVSAGGTFALACAYALPERVTMLGIASCMCPLHLRSTRKKMHWVRLYLLLSLAKFPILSRQVLWLIVALSNIQPEWMYKKVMLTQSVLAITEYSFDEMNALFRADYKSIFQQKNGIRALTNEAQLYFHWGVRMNKFPQHIPVYVWHGKDDTVVPWSVIRPLVQHVAERTVLVPGGHLCFISRMSEILTTMNTANHKTPTKARTAAVA